MSICDLLPVFLFACFAAIFIEFSYAYPPYETCSGSTDCNNSTLKYPFENWRGEKYCNNIAYVDCRNNQSTLLCFPNIQLYPDYCSNNWYRVVGDITQSSYTNYTIRIAPDTSNLLNCYLYNNMIQTIVNFFDLSDKYRWGTVVICKNKVPYTDKLKPIRCLDCRSTADDCFFLPDQLSISMDGSCSNYSLVIPADRNSYNSSTEEDLRNLLQGGFEIKWNASDDCRTCEVSGGICYTPFYKSSLEACICRDGAHRYSCFDGNPIRNPQFNKKKKKITLRYIAVISGVLSAIFMAATTIITLVWINGKKRKEREEEQGIRAYMDPLDSRRPSVENFIDGGNPTRYSHVQIKRYTNNFADRIGQGGFGTVFKGKLPNGSLVAVKILDKSKHSQTQFMNEVATIGRIHHVHLVRLLGYCFEGSKRALVYEYMVNGSLDKYIHGDDQNTLDWKQLYSIAMGTARGMVYLHDDCRSQILHCDIKPHNVLLDANFFPKVADFGLAKLIDREETHVSLTGARGTPGYVAPEVWSKNYGPVSDKSDVYSYGMLVMEMVGGRKNLDMKATRSSRFYYPEWAFKQVEMGDYGKLREGNITDEEDENIAKKLSLLGLWCIQYNPSQRPSMSRVIQMLEGTTDITIPPQPFPVNTSPQTTDHTESSSSM